jgi:4-hydroxythreonine-4-phosphate dehydrogenase
LAGFQAGWSIQTATDLAQKKLVSALVTGPIHKERMTAGGFSFPGHTEFLAKLCSKRGAPARVTMMLANDLLRVSLVTTHLAVGRAPKKITAQAIRLATLNTYQSLRDWWGIRKPKIAIAALNPHAGEGGLFGHEEKTIIAPAVRTLARSLRGKAELIGPLPADTLFAKHILAPQSRRYDAVICMYHDQGLIPVKLLDFPHTVNITLGLPIIRTSVDHGVGFDIAGKGVADPTSMDAALHLAARLVRLSRQKKR